MLARHGIPDPEVAEDCPKGPTPVLVLWLLPVLDGFTRAALRAITVPQREGRGSALCPSPSKDMFHSAVAVPLTLALTAGPTRSRMTRRTAGDRDADPQPLSRRGPAGMIPSLCRRSHP